MGEVPLLEPEVPDPLAHDHQSDPELSRGNHLEDRAHLQVRLGIEDPQSHQSSECDVA